MFDKIGKWRQEWKTKRTAEIAEILKETAEIRVGRLADEAQIEELLRTKPQRLAERAEAERQADDAEFARLQEEIAKLDQTEKERVAARPELLRRRADELATAKAAYEATLTPKAETTPRKNPSEWTSEERRAALMKWGEKRGFKKPF